MCKRDMVHFQHSGWSDTHSCDINHVTVILLHVYWNKSALLKQDHTYMAVKITDMMLVQM